MRRETLGEKAWAGDRKPCAPWAAQRVAGTRESMLISHRRRGYRAHTLFLKKEEHLSWSPLTRGGRGGISSYLAAERPGPGGLGPSGAGSPSGRRWKQLERERREAGRELGAASPAPRACGTPLLLSAWSREHPLLGEALQLGPAQEHLTGPFRQSLRSTVFGPLVTNGNPKRGSHAPKATQLDRGPLASLF